ncbi:unnamed protein product [Clonostachys rosea]|uniref:DUF7136 domain-containing protein n=1 Tax=Bionectria ochroleuca TaxID=29856 RepID=A0ABY6UY69_BIOOC|nr:unnamed protein product [Clonostachys rosea]
MQPSSKLLAAAWLASASFLRLGQAQTTTSAAASATSNSIASTTPTSTGLPDNTFEIDIIYPRNETYNATDTFPVVVALQKPHVASRLGKIRFGAYIIPYSNWDTRGGIDVGNTERWLRTYDAANFTGDPFFAVEVTDVTSWNKELGYSGRGLHALIWSILWLDQNDTACGQGNYIDGRIFFTIDDEGVNPNIMDADECPFEGSVVQVNGNETSCPGFTELERGTGNPCAIKIDSAKASSFSSQISSKASPAPAATTTDRTKDDKDNAAGTLGISIALAQAAVLVSASLLWM